VYQCTAQWNLEAECMRKVLIGIAVVGIGGSIALGVRSQLPSVADETEAPASTPQVPGREPVTGLDPIDAADVAAPVDATEVVQEPITEPALAPAGAAPPGGGQAPGGSVSPPQTQRPALPPSGGAAGEQALTAVEILRRASAAYERVTSLRAEFVQELENPLLRTRTVSRGTLAQRRPDRFLMRFSDPAGDVVVGDGSHFWLYYPSVDERQVIRAPVGAAGPGGVDLQAQFIGDPERRFNATLEGRETVAGRPAHVLTLIPREPLGYRRLKVWIDAADHLSRRFEITDEQGSVRQIELNRLEINPRLDDALFRFTPPAGARVIDRG
jgi:outer membrane lipoprotein carrier protein